MAVFVSSPASHFRESGASELPRVVGRLHFRVDRFSKMFTAERLNARGDCAEKRLISEIAMDVLTAKRKICPGKAR